MKDEPKKDTQRLGPWARSAIAVAVVVVCGVAFALVGAFVGIFISNSRWPDSNLAGLVGILYGFPIGFVVGCCLAGITYPYWRTLLGS